MQDNPIRVLYSFPHKLGAARICYTAWHQVNGLALAGAAVRAMPGVLYQKAHADVVVRQTLAWGKLRIPYKLLGRIRACAMHDQIVARRLETLAGQIDVVHAWPLGAELTLRTAERLGIPTVLERPNAHTRFSYEVVQRECHQLGIVLPPNHEHAFNEEILEREEREYQLATKLLCPSEFVVRTFIDKGMPMGKLARHIYGYDEKRFYPDSRSINPGRGLIMLSVGVVAVRKGQHYALKAWLESPASKNGIFLIAGKVLPDYRKVLGPMLEHPSVRLLGHCSDVPDLMRQCDILVLPSIEEGFGLVCTEAMGSGCVPLVSDACTDICIHMENSLVHHVGDVDGLASHITLCHQNRQLLNTLRENGLRILTDITWNAAGVKLLEVYRKVIAD